MLRQRMLIIAALLGALVIGTIAALVWQVPAARGTSASKRSAPKPEKLVWDFSAGRAVSLVGWPAGWAYEPWFIDGPGEVEIILPDRRRATFRFTLVEVRQEAGRVRTIRVFSEAGPLQGAHAEATALMNHWGLGGRESLEKWFMKRRRDGLGDHDPAGPNWATPSNRDDPFPRVGVSVQTTHRSDIPWCVQWGVVFAKPGDATTP